MFLTSIGEYDRKRLIQCGSLTLALAELWKMTALCSPSLTLELYYKGISSQPV